MNKIEFQNKIDAVLDLIDEGRYAAAVERCEELNLDLINQPGPLKDLAKAYEKCRRYEDAELLLLQAHKAAPRSRGILYHLCTVAIKARDLENAELYYEAFCKLAPRDMQRYVIQYRLCAAKGRPVDELIDILEHIRDGEPDDHWLYVLAETYAGRMQNEKALEVCDEIELWFDSGKYVELCRKLRNKLLGGVDETLLTNEFVPDEPVLLDEEMVDAPEEVPAEAASEEEETTAPEETSEEETVFEADTPEETPAEAEESPEEDTSEEPEIRISDPVWDEITEEPEVEEAAEEVSESVYDAPETEETPAVEIPDFEIPDIDISAVTASFRKTEPDMTGIEIPEFVRETEAVSEEIELPEEPADAADIPEISEEDIPAEEPETADAATQRFEAVKEPEIKAEVPAEPEKEEEKEEFVSAYSVSPGAYFFDPEKGEGPAEKAEDPEEEGSWWAAAVKAADDAEREEALKAAMADPIEEEVPEETEPEEEIPMEEGDEHVVISVPVSDIIRPSDKLDEELTFSYDVSVDEAEIEEDAKAEAEEKEFLFSLEEEVMQAAFGEEEDQEIKIPEEKPGKAEIPAEDKKEKKTAKKSGETVEDEIFSGISNLFEEEETVPEKKADAAYGGLPVNPEIGRKTWHFMIAAETQEAAEKCAAAGMDKINALNPQADLAKARVNAVKISHVNIVDNLEKFLGNMTLILKASRLSDEQLSDFARVLERDDRSLMIVFEDTKENIEDIMRRVPALAESFTAVMEVSEFTPELLLETALEVLSEQEAVMDSEAEKLVLEKAAALLEAGTAQPQDAIREMTSKALTRAEKGHFLGFGAGKIDKEGVLHLKAKHFKGL